MEKEKRLSKEEVLKRMKEHVSEEVYMRYQYVQAEAGVRDMIHGVLTGTIRDAYLWRN